MNLSKGYIVLYSDENIIGIRCEIFIHVARELIVDDILKRARSDAVVLVTLLSISVAWFSDYRTLIWYHWIELSICVIICYIVGIVIPGRLGIV